MIGYAFEAILSFVVSVLFAGGVVGFFIAWAVTVYAYYTNKIPSFIAIALTTGFTFACAFLLAWTVATGKATKEAEFKCILLQEEAKTAAKEATVAAQKRIMEMQKTRASIAERARLVAAATANDLASQLKQAKAKQSETESKINELEKTLPENSTCTTGDALYRELSD